MRVRSLLFLVSLGAVFPVGSAVVSGCTSLPDLVDVGDASLANEITLADGGHAIVESDGAIVPTGDDTNPGSDGSTGTMTGDDGSTGTMTGDDDASMPGTDGGMPTDAAGGKDTGAADTGAPDTGPPVCTKDLCGTNGDCAGCTECGTAHPCVTCAQIRCNNVTPPLSQCCVTNGIATCAMANLTFHGTVYTCP